MDRADVVLADGSTVHIRPVQPQDADGLVALHSRLSERTRYLRYFSPYPRIPPRDLERFANVDHHDREALVAESGADLLGVARYERLGPGAEEAEVAFVVEDAHQGRGLGSVLLEHLAERARAEGITRFVAEVLPANARMQRVFAEAGYEVARRYADGVVHLAFPLARTSRLESVQQNRERRADAASAGRLLDPRGVAVYGARADGTGLGAALLRHLRDGGFDGPILPVHRTAATVEGIPAVPALAPDAADLALIVVPAPAVPGVIDECAAAGVTGVVVVTSGVDRDDLVRQVRGHGMRLVGPASLGLANARRRLNATLSPRLPEPGRVAFFSQSAALGIALLAEAGRRGFGMSAFVSAGDRADVSGNDLMQYWYDDPGTDAVLLYLETFGNPRKFARIARDLARRKPVVVLASADRSRGAPLDAGAVAAMFASSGVIRVHTIGGLFDVGALVASQPLPAGTRLGVVCDAAAFAALATGAAPAAGLAVTSVTVLPTGISATGLAEAVEKALGDDAVDAVLVAYAPPAPEAETARHDAVALAVEATARDADKPVLAVYPTGVRAGDVPVYPSIEEAVRALGRVAAYAAWRREPAGALPDISGQKAAAIIGDEGWTAAAPGPDPRAEALLAAYGIELVPGRRLMGDPSDVARAAARLGFPVALKVAAAPWRHRLDLGAVRLRLADAEEVAEVHAELRERFGFAVEVVVQRMAPDGVPCVIRVVDDPAFGPAVGFGLAGLAADLLGDIVWHPAPLTDRDAERLVRAPRAAPLLSGYRGTPAVDVAALVDLLLRIGRLAADQPGLAAVELNPVLVAERGLSVLSAEVNVGPPASRPDTGPRRLV